MKTSCVSVTSVLCACFGLVLAAPAPEHSVFQRNGLQREQEGALHREPFEPLSPFQISHTNVPAGGNIIVVPPTISVDPTLPKTAPVDNYQALGLNRNFNFLNHFEVLNKDALVGLLIEKDIPFYVKTVVEPQKPVQTKIHVMRVPKKHEQTTPLPDLNLNMVEIVNVNNATKENNDDGYESITNVKQVESLVAASRKLSNSDVLVKVTERRAEDVSVEQETPFLTVTDAVQSASPNNNLTHSDDTPLQNDDPNVSPPTTLAPVYEHAVIYTPEKRPDSKTIWEHIGSAYDKAKEKTSEFVEKAKDKTDKFIDKAREKAKDVLNSNESKSKEIVNPADDI
uniref:Uncharacterized protein n=1 Tax=Cacopsylla melanoneura TaxID=428564 RepID=A0A8D8RKH4_9HEMI